MKQLSLILLLAMLLAACEPAPAVITATGEPVRLLATVYISPTPDAAQREATRLAQAPSATLPPTRAPLTPTPYVGVFIGEADVSAGGVIPFAFDLPPVDPTQPPVVLSRNCPVALDAFFVDMLNALPTTAQAMGCPIQQLFGFDAQVQVFERGVIYRHNITGELWAIAPGGQTGGNYWYVAAAPLPGPVLTAPPQGLRVPQDDIGALWSGLPEVSRALGFANTAVENGQVQIQRFDGGSLLRDALTGTIFVLFADGTAQGPFGG